MDFYDSSEEEYSSNNELSCVESDDENIMTGGGTSYKINKILENKLNLDDLKKIFKEIIFFEKDNIKYHFFIADRKDLNFNEFFDKTITSLDDKNRKKFQMLLLDHIKYIIYQRNINGSIRISEKEKTSDDTIEFSKKFEEEYIDKLEGVNENFQEYNNKKLLKERHSFQKQLDDMEVKRSQPKPEHEDPLLLDIEAAKVTQVTQVTQVVQNQWNDHLSPNNLSPIVELNKNLLDLFEKTKKQIFGGDKINIQEIYTDSDDNLIDETVKKAREFIISKQQLIKQLDNKNLKEMYSDHQDECTKRDAYYKDKKIYPLEFDKNNLLKFYIGGQEYNDRILCHILEIVYTLKISDEPETDIYFNNAIKNFFIWYLKAQQCDDVDVEDKNDKMYENYIPETYQNMIKYIEQIRQDIKTKKQSDISERIERDLRSKISNEKEKEKLFHEVTFLNMLRKGNAVKDKNNINIYTHFLNIIKQISSDSYENVNNNIKNIFVIFDNIKNQAELDIKTTLDSLKTNNPLNIEILKDLYIEDIVFLNYKLDKITDIINNNENNFGIKNPCLKYIQTIIETKITYIMNKFTDMQHLYTRAQNTKEIIDNNIKKILKIVNMHKLIEGFKNIDNDEIKQNILEIVETKQEQGLEDELTLIKDISKESSDKNFKDIVAIFEKIVSLKKTWQNIPQSSNQVNDLKIKTTYNIDIESLCEKIENIKKDPSIYEIKF